MSAKEADIFSIKRCSDFFKISTPRFIKWIYLKLSKTPLFGHLLLVNSEDLWAAFEETFIYIILATMPFWLGAIITYGYNLQISIVDGKIIDLNLFLSLLKKSLNNGELYILSSSLLAPAILLTWHETQKNKNDLPSKKAVGFTILIVMVICTSLFSAQKANPNQNVDFIFFVSGSLAILSLILRFTAVAYSKYREMGPEAMQKDRDVYVEKFLNHR